MIETVAVNDFLAAAGWQNAQRAALAGDASRRRFERLHLGSETAILMISPPAVDPTLPQFLQITQALRGAGLSAPSILAADPAIGLALLEDLGPTLLLHPDYPGHATALPRVLDTVQAYGALRPDVPTSSPGQMQEAVASVFPNRTNPPSAAWSDFLAALGEKLDGLEATPKALSLRDLHAGNLTWLPQRGGVAQIGLLDYQDAFLTHPMYEAVSLLRDVRVPYPEELTLRLKSEFGQAQALSTDETDLAFDVLTVQRNTRILGIFIQLAENHGKTNYLQYVPRVCATLDIALTHPDLAAMRTSFQHAFSSLNIEALQ